MAKALEKARHQLHSDHLLLFLRVRYALVINSSFECKLFVVATLLLLDQFFDKLMPSHRLSVVEIWFFTLILLSYSWEKATNSFVLFYIKSWLTLLHLYLAFSPRLFRWKLHCSNFERSRCIDVVYQFRLRLFLWSQLCKGIIIVLPFQQLDLRISIVYHFREFFVESDLIVSFDSLLVRNFQCRC